MNIMQKEGRLNRTKELIKLMKQITKKEVYHIVSEPGDATRYDYYMAQDYTDFSFMPANSTIQYPQRLSYWEVQDLTEEEIVEMANKHNCNPWTLKECVRSINERNPHEKD